MRAVQVVEPGAPFKLVECPKPEAGPGEVRIRVQACGICHSDAYSKEGAFPGIKYPIVPGHEIVGIVDAVGVGIEGWKLGQRVGVGWNGGACGHCEPCRHGDFVLCATAGIPGITYDGGYADYMIAPAAALVAIPDSLGSIEAAPLLCAGITTYNALRHSGAMAGDLVAILGLGGLGHLGVQFAVRMGYKTVVVARGSNKAQFARDLGAAHYIDSTIENVAEELTRLGGAKVVLATVTVSDAMSATIDGLSRNGVLLVVGASAEPITVSPIQLISGRKSIKGWPSGSSKDSEETLMFSAQTAVRPLVEVYPLERVSEAYDRMMSGAARFKVVLDMSA
jgi:D-arabinose 1-dehydrogenase-like Zn-dependent alcohol dehydrogenase